MNVTDINETVERAINRSAAFCNATEVVYAKTAETHEQIRAQLGLFCHDTDGVTFRGEQIDPYREGQLLPWTVQVTPLYGFVRGRCYMLRGGHILRCHGLYAGTGPMVAFQEPSAELTEDAAGLSFDPHDVLHEVTAEDRATLATRIAELEGRNLWEAAAEIRLVLAEVTAGKE